MKITKTELAGVILIEPQVFKDNRGFFFESYNFQKLQAMTGINIAFFQDNHSASTKATLRGLHYQLGKSAQTKLVRCIQGEIMDIAVDLRQASPTFGQWTAVKLSAENKLQLYIPHGFAHGFAVLSEAAEVCYKCDNYYVPADERGIIWNDPDLNIEWGITDPIVSAKDQKLPRFKELPQKNLF